jgi:ABC-type Na+ efflux pump permease subunit
VVVGLVAIALGGMLYAAAVDTAAGVGPGPAAGIGSLLAVLGAVLFIIGLLTEFFAMGSFLESIALSSQETASLLRSHQPAVPGSSSPSKDSLVSLRL